MVPVDPAAKQAGRWRWAIIVNAPFDVTELVVGVHKFLSVVSLADRVYFFR